MGQPVTFRLHFGANQVPLAIVIRGGEPTSDLVGRTKLTSSGTGFRRTRKLPSNKMAVSRVHLGLKVDQAHWHFCCWGPGYEMEWALKKNPASPVHMRCESIVGTTNAAHELTPGRIPIPPTKQQRDWSTWEPVAHQKHTMKDRW